MKKKPEDRVDDPFLADKLCAEAEGIFLWCLAGLKRLTENNFRFTESEGAKANREEARRDADNVIPFLRSEGYIRLNAEGAIPSAELYAIYKQWCEDNAVKPLSARTVSVTLKRHAEEFRLEHDNHIVNRKGREVNGFRGIEGVISQKIL